MLKNDYRLYYHLSLSKTFCLSKIFVVDILLERKVNEYIKLDKKILILYFPIYCPSYIYKFRKSFFKLSVPLSEDSNK